jgi:hypothetical protein
MVKIKRSDGLPANFDELPDDMKRIIEEGVYKRQLRWSHGYSPGDPALTSMGASGIPRSASFGKKVDEESDEEAEGHED